MTIIGQDEYQILNAHQKRMCHPETCCCETDYVLVKNGAVWIDIQDEKEGKEWINYYAIRTN